MTTEPTNQYTEAAPPGDGRPQILPFLACCDRSTSMENAPINAINTALPALHQTINREFDVADKVRFGVISFASDATEDLPLSDLGFVDQMPTLNASGSTNYAQAFTLLRQAIERGIADLNAEGFDVLRPVVFLLTDGAPDGGPFGPWLSAYNDLIDPNFALHPHIIAFGIGDADPTVISRVATLKAYMAADNTSPADAVRQWATRFTQSIVQSARSFNNNGGPSLVIPPTPTGFQDLPLDVVSVP